ncbi:MAG: 50S ribosomal protein L22 [Anaerolineae bacterium]|nr:50S ribosomal protein L22 [Anaerolineae bacterium]
MDVYAQAKYLPISAQKIRLVLNKVRGLGADEAVVVLKFMPQKGARLVEKLLSSAIANAEENFELNHQDLVVAQIYADEGPTRKWRKFGARGRFKPWLRRSAHVTVVLKEREEFSDYGA